MFVTYPDVPWWPGAPVLYEGGTATAGMRAHEQLNPSPLHGRNRACLYVAAEPPAIRSLTRVCAALRLVAQWYTTWVLRQFGGGVMLPHWRHVLELVSCPGLGLCGVRERSRAWFPDNVARNSPAAASNLDFASLELQRFEQCSKNDRGELRATFIRRDTVAPPGPLAPSALVVCGAWCVLLGKARGPQVLSG